MDFSTIKFETPEREIGLITLNRPDRLNALNLDMLDDLHALFDQLKEMESVRVLVVTGAGRGFCSGADLKDALDRREFIQSVMSTGSHLIHIQKKYADRILEMRALPQPIIAAVNGPAAGGGMCIALASDIVFASRQAVFIPSFINIGLSGGELGTSYFLPRAVGTVRASEILMTGRRVEAEEAERIGLANCVVDHEGLMAAAIETARLLLTKSVLGLRLTKEALNLNLNASSLTAAIEFENRNQSICCTMPEFLSAVEQFGKMKA